MTKLPRSVALLAALGPDFVTLHAIHRTAAVIRGGIQTLACRLYLKHAVYILEGRGKLLVAAIRDARRNTR